MFSASSNLKNHNRRLGGANQPGNRFVSFVRACARSGCLVKTGLGSHANPSSLFPFSLGDPSLFPLGSVNLSEIKEIKRNPKTLKQSENIWVSLSESGRERVDLRVSELI